MGADPSVADAYLYVVLTWAHGKQVDLTGLDNLAAFFKRMQENSGVKAARKAEGLEYRRATQARQRPAPGRRMMAAWRRLGAAACGALVQRAVRCGQRCPCPAGSRNIAACQRPGRFPSPAQHRFGVLK